MISSVEGSISGIQQLIKQTNAVLIFTVVYVRGVEWLEGFQGVSDDVNSFWKCAYFETPADNFNFTCVSTLLLLL